LRAIAALAKSRILSTDAPAEALQLLETSREYASRLRLSRQLVRIDLLRAGLLDELKNTDEARACLITAITEGQRLGLVRTFVDEGSQIANLLALLIRDRAIDDELLPYASDLLEKISGPVGKLSGAATRRANALKAQTALTKREVEILDLVAKAMSTKRIALALNITLETVKWNLRNIFSKLGVSSRYDAMIWARNNGLID
jgi:LuxR family maltose regulon positive regulatory protein